jgi:glycosyltransferase involved in cell wall biosynthesis
MDGSCHRRCSATAKFKHADSPFLLRFLKYPLFAYTTHIEPRLMQSVDQFVAIGPTSKTIFEANGVDIDQTTMIPLCMNPRFENAASGVQYDNSFRILHISQLTRLKGVDVLIDAIRHVDHEVEVDIVGRVPDEIDLFDQAVRLGVEDKFTFHGYLQNDQLSPLYDTADVFVHPSRFPDPMPRTMVEALQTETPLVVSDSGDPPWAVGEAGLTFESENAPDLARVLTRLIENDDLLNTLRQACITQRKSFSAEAAQQRFEQLYRSLTDSPSGAVPS